MKNIIEKKRQQIVVIVESRFGELGTPICVTNLNSLDTEMFFVCFLCVFQNNDNDDSTKKNNNKMAKDYFLFSNYHYNLFMLQSNPWSY